MSFENLKKDLKEYDGRSHITLAERLALYRSLEDDISSLTGRAMDDYDITEQECSSDSLIANLAWLGRIFNGVYSKNREVISNNSGKPIKRVFDNAGNSAEELRRERERLQEAQKEQKKQEKEIELLKDELSELRRSAGDTEAAKREYESLLEQCRVAREQLKAQVPFDIEGARRELEAVRKEEETLKASRDEAQRNFENQMSVAYAKKERIAEERALILRKIDELTCSNNDIRSTFSELEAELLEKQIEKAELQKFLSNMRTNIDAQNSEVNAVQAQIDAVNAERDGDRKSLTELQIELSNIKDSNESFRRMYIFPVEAELTHVKEEAAVLEAERVEKDAQLTEYKNKIQELRTTNTQLANLLDAQRSNEAAAQANLDKSNLKLDEIKASISAKEEAKKAADEEALSLNQELMVLETAISTMELTTSPALKAEIESLSQKKSALDEEMAELTAQSETLKSDVAAAEEEKLHTEKILCENRKVFGLINEELNTLKKEVDELSRLVEEGNPEEAKKRLEKTKEVLIQQKEKLEADNQAFADSAALLRATTAQRNESKGNIQKIKASILQREKECEALQNELSSLEKRFEYLSSDECKAQADKLNAKLGLLKTVADNMKSLANKLPEKNRGSNEMQLINGTLGEIKKNLDSLQEQINKMRTFYKENIL